MLYRGKGTVLRQKLGKICRSFQREDFQFLNNEQDEEQYARNENVNY